MNTYNIEIFFAKNPDTPPKTTRDTEFKERKENWDKRINKAKEQAQIKPMPYSQVFGYVNEFLNMVKHQSNEVNDKKSIELLSLDADNLALILDKGIIAQGCSWSTPIWNEEKHMYTFWDTKYDSMKERFQLNYPSDIIWMKFTNKGHLGVIAKSFDINYRSDNNSGKLVEIIGEKWDDSFVFIFPLTKDILYGRKIGDIERAIGNYLIMKGVPIIDFYSHNY